jgi:hypothetical protein
MFFNKAINLIFLTQLRALSFGKLLKQEFISFRHVRIPMECLLSSLRPPICLSVYMHETTLEYLNRFLLNSILGSLSVHCRFG